MSTVTVKRNDSQVEFGDSLTVDGVAVDLTYAIVLFLMLHANGTLVTGTATIDAVPSTGLVTYTATAANLAATGKYRQEWQATFPDGRVLTFPSTGWNTVLVIDDLNPA